jgi:hypothetical protein
LEGTLTFTKVLSHVRKISKEKGIFFTIHIGFNRVLCFIYYKLTPRNRTFLFQGHEYRYFYSFINTTWINERCIEIPIVMEIVKNYRGKKILEVGNVLSHYFSFKHLIVDKYEIANGVINQDVVDVKPKEKYDLIISISTLEHVGWDEKPRDNMKIPNAIENLKGLLRPNDGMIIVTFPLGYNSVLDRLLKDKVIRFTKIYYLKRISKSNGWKEVSWEDVQDTEYGKPFPFANALVIGIISG